MLIDEVPLAELSADQEDALAVFLKKVQKACDNDKSLPGFINPQVSEWLGELESKRSSTPEFPDKGGQ